MRPARRAGIVPVQLPGVAVAPIRVVLGPMPVLLGDIIRETLAGHDDLEIVAEVRTDRDVIRAAQRTGANVGLVAIQANDTHRVLALVGAMVEYPSLLLIALTTDARFGYVYQLQPRAVTIADLSPASLVEAMRGIHPEGVHLPLHPFSPD